MTTRERGLDVKLSTYRGGGGHYKFSNSKVCWSMNCCFLICHAVGKECLCYIC